MPNTFEVQRYNGKKYKVTLPGDDATEEDANAYLDNKYGAKPVEEMSAMERIQMLPDKRSFGEALGAGGLRSLSRMKSTVTNVIPAMIDDAIGRKDLAENRLINARYAEAKIQRENPAQFQSLSDVKGLGDVGNFLAENFGEQGANIALTVATGGIGALVGRGMAARGLASRTAVGGTGAAAQNLDRVALQRAQNAAEFDLARTARATAPVGPLLPTSPAAIAAARSAATPEAIAAARNRLVTNTLLPQAKRAGAAAGAGVGIALGSFAQTAPEVYQGVYEKTGKLSLPAALIGGGVNAALEAVVPTAVLSAFKKTPGLQAAVAQTLLRNSGMTPGLVKTVGKTVLKTAAKEGVTEGAQELVNIAAERIVGENYEALTSEDFNRVFEASVRGAAAGGPFGVVEGVGKYSETRAEGDRQLSATQDREARIAKNQQIIQTRKDLADARTAAKVSSGDPVADAEAAKKVTDLELQLNGLLNIPAAAPAPTAPGATAPGAAPSKVEDILTAAGISMAKGNKSGIPNALRYQKPITAANAQVMRDFLQSKIDDPATDAATKAKIQTLLDTHADLQPRSDVHINKDIAAQTAVVAEQQAKHDAKPTTANKTVLTQANNKLQTLQDELTYYNADDAGKIDIDQNNLRKKLPDFTNLYEYVHPATFKGIGDAGKLTEKELKEMNAQFGGGPTNEHPDLVRQIVQRKLDALAKKTITSDNENKINNEITRLGAILDLPEFSKAFAELKTRARTAGPAPTPGPTATAVEEPEPVVTPEEPVAAAPVEEPVAAAPVEVPVAAAPVEVPVAAAPVEVPEPVVTPEEPVAAAPVEEPVAAAPVAEEPTPTPAPKASAAELVAEHKQAVTEIVDEALADIADNADNKAERMAIRKKTHAMLEDAKKSAPKAVVAHITEEQERLKGLPGSSATAKEKAHTRAVAEQINAKLGSNIFDTSKSAESFVHSAHGGDVFVGSREAFKKRYPQYKDTDYTGVGGTAAGNRLRSPRDGKWIAAIFSDNNSVDQAFGTFLHELSGHIGIRKIINSEQIFNGLVGQIDKWAESKDTKIENTIARKARDNLNLYRNDPMYLEKDGKTPNVFRLREELLAQFISFAAEDIKSSGTPNKKVILAFLQKIVQRIKALFGGKSTNPITAEEILQLAHGVALNMTGSGGTGAQTKAEKAAASRADVRDLISGQAVNPEDFDAFMRMPYPELETKLYSAIDSGLAHTPAAVRRTITTGVETLSNLPTPIRNFVNSLRSLTSLADYVRPVNKKMADLIEELRDVINARAEDSANRKEVLEEILVRAKKLTDKYSSAMMEKFNRIAHDSTVDGVDFSDPENSNNPLYREFYALDKPLQDIYFEVVDSYKKYSTEYLKMLEKLAGPAFTVAMKEKHLRMQRRLVPYLPLYREGDYWVGYTNPEGDPVVEAFESRKERLQRISFLKANGVTNIESFARRENITTGSMPPTAAFAEILKTLKEANVNDAIVQDVYRTYLSLFPDKSIKQQYNPRKNTAGYRQDIFRNFAAVGAKMANDLAQFAVTGPLDDIYTSLRTEALGEHPSELEKSVGRSLDMQEAFVRSPVPSRGSAIAGTFSYWWFILGNISSGIINITTLPMVTYSLLAGKHGIGKTNAAMATAMRMYFSGGKDHTTLMTVPGTKISLKDVSFMGDKGRAKFETSRPDLVRAYEAAVTRGAIRRSTGVDVAEFKKQNLEDFTGNYVQVKATLGWVFQNSERMNREVTFIAAYELARAEYKDAGGKTESEIEAAAIKDAIYLTEQANGSATSETGPQLFQSGLGKIAGTFKRFPVAQLFLQAKLFHEAFISDGSDSAAKRNKEIARNQLFGILGASLIFTGTSGLPLMGGLSILASMLFGDDDEPADLNQWMLETLGEFWTYGPLNYVTNLDIASRTQLGALVRLDPGHIADVGPHIAALEILAGPSASILKNMWDGYQLFTEGHTERGIEKFVPTVVKNVLKAGRFANEGVLTKQGAVIDDDVNLASLVAQIAGFTPADVAAQMTLNSIRVTSIKAAAARKSSLLDRRWGITQDGNKPADVRAWQEEVDKYNSSKFGSDDQITTKTVARSTKGKIAYIRDSMAGISVPKKQRENVAEIGR